MLAQSEKSKLLARDQIHIQSALYRSAHQYVNLLMDEGDEENAGKMLSILKAIIGVEVDRKRKEWDAA